MQGRGQWCYTENMTTLSNLITTFGAEETRDGWEAQCPSHADDNPSLRLSVGGSGKVLLVCRAGCATRDVLATKGLTMRDLAGAVADVEPDHLASDSGGPLPEDIAREALRRATEAYAGSNAERYAHERWGSGVSRVQLGATPTGLVVPLTHADGTPIGWQTRALPNAPESQPRWQSPPSGPRMGWVIPTEVLHPTVIVTEGPSDAVTAACQGYRALALLGATGHQRHRVLEYLGDYAAQAVLAPDNDEAGGGLRDALELRALSVAPHADLTDAYQEGRTIDELLAAIPQHRGPAPDPRRYRPTDLGAARFAAEFSAWEGHPLRWAPGVGPLALYGGVWRVVGVAGLRTIVHRAVDRIAEVADHTPQDKDLSNWSKRVQSSNGVDAILRELRALPGIPVPDEALDAHPDLLCVRNGVIDLRTGKLHPHDPSLLLTKMIDLEYDPAAHSPLWDRLLRDWHDREDVREMLQTVAGYGLSGRTSEQAFLIHLGRGANGKSVFLDTLYRLGGPTAAVTPFSTFERRQGGGIPNDIAALRGVRFVSASEGEAGMRMDEASLKRITGGDPISARFMRGEFFTFTPQLTLHLATNAAPAFRGQDEGLWRRVIMVPWRNTIPKDKRDPLLGDKIAREMQGILAWAVRGAVRWYAEGLARPEGIDESTNEYRRHRDELVGFLPGVVVPDPQGRLWGDDLYRAYRRWHELGGSAPQDIWSRRHLYSVMAERGVERRDGNRGVRFVGIRLADDWESDSPWK